MLSDPNKMIAPLSFAHAYCVGLPIADPQMRRPINVSSPPQQSGPCTDEIVFAPALSASPMKLETAVRRLATRPELQKIAKLYRDRASWPSVLSYAQARAICEAAGVLDG